MENPILDKKTSERGRIRVRVILMKIFLHEEMILIDSKHTPKNPKNCSSSCSLSMDICFSTIEEKDEDCLFGFLR